MAGPAIAPVFDLFAGMAIDAPRHAQGLLSGNSIHGSDGAMAGCAFQAGLDVPFVSEMHEIGNVIDFDPGYGLTVGVILRDFDDLRFIGSDRPVATHAFFHRWHAGHRRTGGIDMTVLTGNFIFPGVDSMTEFDGLKRAGVTKISAVYPDSRDKSCHPAKDNQGRFLKMSKSFQNRN